MKCFDLYRLVRGCLLLLLISFVGWASVVQAGQADWQRQQVNWHITGGGRIKAIYYPKNKAPAMLAGRKGRWPKKFRRQALGPEAVFRLAPLAQKFTTEKFTTPIFASVIDSPPIDGFVPWVVVAITDERSDELELDAIPRASVVGNYLTANPESDYAIGIFDTGASAHVIGNAAAIQAGLFSADLITSNTCTIFGVTGSVDAWVSQPIGLFIDGLGAVEPSGLLLDTTGMVGETNVSIAVGQGGSPDLPTAIGSPMSVYFTASFRNDQQVTVIHDGDEFSGPDIRLYESDDPCIPDYSNIIPLELRPLGALSVQYIPSLEGMFEFPPASPSVIIGNLSQSIFFVHSVDLTDGDKSTIDKDRFIFDTGAQITVVGSRVAARLALKPYEPEFEVEIQGITGDIIMAPGFYIDSIQIPALGEWLSFTDIPVVLLDVFSPEGGTADGVIGMNLFVNYNFVFRGGGLFLQDDPTVEFELIGIVGDIAPEDGDRMVNLLDLAEFADHWLELSTSPNWNPQCDMFPQSAPDGRIDFFDFAVLAQHWAEGT